MTHEIKCIIDTLFLVYIVFLGVPRWVGLSATTPCYAAAYPLLSLTQRKDAYFEYFTLRS
jgi:hypothetical protein